MSHHLNLAVPNRLRRTAEGFDHCGITNAVGRPKAQAIENYVHTIRIAGIDNRSFAISWATTEFRRKG